MPPLYKQKEKMRENLLSQKKRQKASTLMTPPILPTLSILDHRYAIISLGITN